MTGQRPAEQRSQGVSVKIEKTTLRMLVLSGASDQEMAPMKIPHETEYRQSQKDNQEDLELNGEQLGSPDHDRTATSTEEVIPPTETVPLPLDTKCLVPVERLLTTLRNTP